MLTSERPDLIQAAFDDQRLVANAELLLPVTLAGRLGLGELADSHLYLGDAPGWANVGDKMLTLVASALVSGDCIDAAAALCAGGRRGCWDGRSRPHRPRGYSCAAFAGCQRQSKKMPARRSKSVSVS